MLFDGRKMSSSTSIALEGKRNRLVKKLRGGIKSSFLSGYYYYYCFFFFFFFFFLLIVST